MDTLRKTVAALCAMLFIITGMIALLAFNIEWYAFNSAIYKRAFERQNLYERTPDILADALYTSISKNANVDPYLKELNVEDWKGTIASFVPPTELKAITDATLDSVFDYLNGKKDTAVISLLPIKQHLVGPGGVQLIQKILLAQPPCTAEQLLQMGLGFLSGNIGLCNPPPEMMNLLNPLIESQIQLIIGAIPNEVTLISSAPGESSGDPRVRLQQIRTLMKVSPVFPVFFLFCITAFAVRSLTDWLQWWGYPFLITGGISALIALIGASVVGIIVQSILEIYGLGFLPPILLSAIRETVSTVTGEILRPVLIEGLILAVLGFSMALTTLFITYRNNRRT